jgi:hypothetical protein
MVIGSHLLMLCNSSCRFANRFSEKLIDLLVERKDNNEELLIRVRSVCSWHRFMLIQPCFAGAQDGGRLDSGRSHS